MARGQNRPQQPRDVVAPRAERLAERLEERVRWIDTFTDEAFIKPADQELPRGGLFEQDAHAVAAAPAPRLPEDGLGPVVVQAGVEREAAGTGPPAGEGAGGLADVLLAVVADAQAEQLH